MKNVQVIDRQDWTQEVSIIRKATQVDLHERVSVDVTVQSVM